MYSLTFTTIGQVGNLNSTVSSGTAASYPVEPGVTFLASDAAITSAWATIQSAGTFVDGLGFVQTPAQATFWKDTVLDSNGRWASGDVNTASTNSGQYAVASGTTDTGSFTFSGNVTAGGTLGVTGAATLGSTLGVTGASTLTGNATFAGRVIRSAANALTALAGGAQAGTALAKDVNRFTTVATAGDSAQLPVSAAGLIVTVINKSANSMNVFPQTGDAINALAANAALAVAAGVATEFFCTVAGTWDSK